MSEEEILKECTELAENEHHELGDCWDEEYSSSAIFGLIMLYKQTKNELNNLKEIEQLHQEENGKLRVELEQEKEKNNNLIKQLQEQNTEIQDISRQLRQEKEKNKELTKQLNGAFDRGFISKDKLKSFFQDKIIYRQFELQQEYKDFKDDVRLNTLQDIKEEILGD